MFSIDSIDLWRRACITPLGDAIKGISAGETNCDSAAVSLQDNSDPFFAPEERMQHKIEHDKCVPF
jgi:hypothetical protein